MCWFSTLEYTRDPAELFFSDKVQELLNRITKCDYEKVFKTRKMGGRMKAPKYELMTQQEIDQLLEETAKKAKERLKMPPLMNERKPIEKVLSYNPEISGFDNTNYVFTDITYGMSNRVRSVINLNSGLCYVINLFPIPVEKSCCGERTNWCFT